MSSSRHLFFLMNHIFIGFFLAALYGAVAAATVWYFEGYETFGKFHNAYFVAFNCSISGGLIVSAAILVYKTQESIPKLIRSVLSEDILGATEYSINEQKYFAIHRSLSFSSTFAVISFGIFYLAKFPFEGLPEYLLIAAGSAQYALAVYVGRKLFYIAQMLHAIEPIEVDEDIFTDDRLGPINTYVNSISTFTLIFVFTHVYSFYHGPFVYTSFLGETIRVALLLLAVIAAPILVLFNFYPRTVIKSLYMKSISSRIETIQNELRRKRSVSEIERLSYLIEYDKVSRDELKYRMRVTLSDLPIAITIVGILLGLFS